MNIMKEIRLAIKGIGDHQVLGNLQEIEAMSYTVLIVGYSGSTIDELAEKINVLTDTIGEYNILLDIISSSFLLAISGYFEDDSRPVISPSKFAQSLIEKHPDCFKVVSINLKAKVGTVGSGKGMRVGSLFLGLDRYLRELSDLHFNDYRHFESERSKDKT